MFIKTTQELINLNGISRLSLCNNGKTLIACYQGNDKYSILKKFKEPMDAFAELTKITSAIKEGKKVYSIEY